MKSLCTKVTYGFKREVAAVAKAQGRTVSGFLRICVEDAVNGHYRLDGGRLVPTEEYLAVLAPERTSDEPRYDYESLGVDRLLEALERKDCNLRDAIESMIQSAVDAPAHGRKGVVDWGA